MIGTLSADKIEEVLSGNNIGRIGCCDGLRTYVVPVNYIYENGSVIAHSLMGTKIQMMRKNPNVCFQVDEIRNFCEWKSVIAWGKYQELNDNKERYHAMELFVQRTMRMKVSETAVLPELQPERVHPRSPGIIKPIIYRIILTEKTGRYEKGEDS